MCAGLLLNDASALSPVGFVRRISSGREQSEWEASTGLTVNCAELLIWRAVAELLGMHTTPGIVPSSVPPPPLPLRLLVALHLKPRRARQAHTEARKALKLRGP